MYVKRPIEGKVKTRLTGKSGLSKEGAARLYESLLYDLVKLFKEGSKSFAAAEGEGKGERGKGKGKDGKGKDGNLVFEGGSNYDLYICAREYSFGLELSEELGILVIEDRGGGEIGLAMLGSLEDMFELGYKKVVILGSDLPYIRPSDAIEIFKLLTNNDYVLGSDGRGGFYILGTKRVEGKLFSNIEWSVGRDYEILIERIESLGYNLHKYKESKDINFPSDVAKLYREVLGGDKGGDTGGRGRRFKEEMPKTVDMLSKLFHVKHKEKGIDFE